MNGRLFCQSLSGLLILIASCGMSLHAQVAGDFVVPDIRSLGEAEFAYWDLFTPDAEGKNYDTINEPGLLSGIDAAGNTGSLTEGLSFKQVGSPNAFITSSGAIYDFSGPTAFEVELIPKEDEPFTNVIFQTMTGGRRFDLADIRLRYESPEGEMASLRPDYKALDDPATGQFAERLISAFQWDLTGLLASRFVLNFAASGGSMPLWEAQLDVVQGKPFVQELGYLILGNNLPAVRRGPIGAIVKDLPDDSEQRFHLAGSSIDLLAEPEPGFVHLGWIHRGTVEESETLTITIREADVDITAIFAPLFFEDWRNATFFNFSSHTEQTADNLEEEISGPAADYDGDGLSSLEEYAFGTDPYIWDSETALPKVKRIVLEDTPILEIRFMRQASLHEESDLSIEIQSSADLSIWRSRDDWMLVSKLLLANGLREMIYHCPIEHALEFHRLHVSLVE